MAGEIANKSNQNKRDILLGQMPERRATRLKTLLLSLIEKSRHVNADELYQEAKRKEPRLSVSTVYRNLQLFVKMGLIEQRFRKDGALYYEIKGFPRHYHLICLGCGQVIEFESPLAKQIAGKVSEQSGFAIERFEIEMEGYCPECNKQRKDTSK